MVIHGRLRFTLIFLFGTNFSNPELSALLKAFQISSVVLSWKLAKISEDFSCMKDLKPSQSDFLNIGTDLGFCWFIFGLTLTFEKK